jgi:hypothetical protein
MTLHTLPLIPRLIISLKGSSCRLHGISSRPSRGRNRLISRSANLHGHQRRDKVHPVPQGIEASVGQLNLYVTPLPCIDMYDNHDACHVNTCVTPMLCLAMYDTFVISM